MGRLPPELVLLVLKELGRGGRTLRNCSLVCNDWRTFSLPFLYRRLYIQSRRELLACMVMMKNAPHIRPLIQEIATIYDAPDAADPEDNSFDIDDADIREFVRGFVHLHTISRSGFTIFDIPPVLPGSLVTALCIHDRWVNAQELSLLFDASANTIRSLTLDEVAFRDPPPAGDLSQLPTINMAVLEELVLRGYEGPLYPNLRMPRLKVLSCKGWHGVFREALPDSLLTLAVSRECGASLCCSQPYMRSHTALHR